MKDSSKIKEALDMISEICEDTTTPKNVKERLNQITSILKEEVDISIRINKALNELDEIVNDNNMQQYTRTQIWNVVGLLEKK